MLPAVAVVGLATWEIVATVRADADVPGDTAWDEAAALVRARHQPGDLIVFAPVWNDPVGRLHLGDLMTLEQVARMDAARFGTIWEVSIRGERAPETAGLATTDVVETHGVTVRRFERPAAVVLADVVTALPTATTDGRGARPQAEFAEVGFAPHRCVQATPAPNQTLRITFPKLALGRELVGYVGLADIFKRREITAPARLDGELGGVIATSVTMTNTSGWQRFAVATTPGAADVTFALTAIGPGARDRQVCFAAESRQ